MKECRKIESLIYLHRENELSAADERIVHEHSEKCGSCRDILMQLRSIDGAISPLRSEPHGLPGGKSLVGNTVSRIVRKDRSPAVEKVINLDPLLKWLRPALGFAVLAAALLLAYQQSRDARKISDLEFYQKIFSPETGSYTESDARRYIGLMSKEKDFSSAHRITGAAAGIEPISLIGSELADLFRGKRGFFDYLSARYPGLSDVRIEDGIDSRESLILATEGKALMREFERILQQGEN